jgi:hypothetical protein
MEHGATCAPGEARARPGGPHRTGPALGSPHMLEVMTEPWATCADGSAGGLPSSGGLLQEA